MVELDRLWSKLDLVVEGTEITASSRSCVIVDAGTLVLSQ